MVKKAVDESGYTKLATLTLRGVGSDSQRSAIARWLEHQADELRRAGEDYAPNYTAGYWEHWELKD